VSTIFRRTPRVKVRRVGQALFLAHPRSGEVFRANDSVAALWRALEQPCDLPELVALFRSAFPRVAARRMRAEVASMLTALVDAGLVERAPAGR
jgi:hypothetical protein